MFSPRSRIASTVPASRAQSRTSCPARRMVMASAVPQAPPPSTATFRSFFNRKLMPWLRAARSRPRCGGLIERPARAWCEMHCAAVGHALRASARRRPRRSSRRCRCTVPAAARRKRSRAARKVFPACGGSAALAATPPATTSGGRAMSGNSPRKRARLRPTRSSSVSAIAAWKEAQMSATSFSESGAMAVAACRTAVFKPENEKSSLASPLSGRGKSKRLGLPSSAAFSTFGPPG